MKGILLASIVLTTLASSGCVMNSSCETVNDPSGQRVVCVTDGTFSYTRNGNMVSENREYQWENPRSEAMVSTAFNGASSGSATVTIKDAAGKTVYSRSYGYSGQSASDQPTMSGQPGTWTIAINVGAMTGQVAINVRPA